MKKNYVLPEMNIEEFHANEYVASCGSTTKRWFKCNGGPWGTLYYYTGSNGDGTLEDSEKTGYSYATEYGSCPHAHEVDINGRYYDGLYQGYGGTYSVIVYKEQVFNYQTWQWETHHHATRELDVESWEHLKS